MEVVDEVIELDEEDVWGLLGVWREGGWAD